MMKKQTTIKTSTGTTKQRKKRIVFTTLAVSAAGILGYFGWQYFKKKKEKRANNIDEIVQPTIPIIPTTPILDSDKNNGVKPKPTKRYNEEEEKPKITKEFPLKRGSKGEKVRALQQALLRKYSKSILPRYGADGDFGTELFTALKKLQLPTTITASAFNVIVAGEKLSNDTTAQQLQQAIINTDYKKVITLLKTISNIDDYTNINSQFKNYRVNGVRQTLVNAVLNHFENDAQKQAIRFELIRMGLQYDGKKWSLSGLGGLPIITNQATTVWLNANQGVQVANRTVLGNEVSKKLDYTLFENKGKYFLVNTNATNYL
jgi:peptidoglycan hydrolase-like protein with peptidoglycan-binding domain